MNEINIPSAPKFGLSVFLVSSSPLTPLYLLLNRGTGRHMGRLRSSHHFCRLQSLPPIPLLSPLLPRRWFRYRCLDYGPRIDHHVAAPSLLHVSQQRSRARRRDPTPQFRLSIRDFLEVVCRYFVLLLFLSMGGQVVLLVLLPQIVCQCQ